MQHALAIGGGQSVEKFPATSSAGYAVVTGKSVKVFANAALPVTAKTFKLTGRRVFVRRHESLTR